MRSRKLFVGLTLILAIVAVAVFGTGARAAAQHEKVLHSFNNDGKDGINPSSGLIFDAAGNLYGTTPTGGNPTNCAVLFAAGCGTVYELMPKAGGVWTEKILHTFPSSTEDGDIPSSALILDKAGRLYGTTSQGGKWSFGGNVGGGTGTVFQLALNARGGWTEKILHAFRADGTDGQGPRAGLVFDRARNLYGTTYSGGLGYNCIGAGTCSGTVFELTPQPGGVWTEGLLHVFGQGTDGIFPDSGFVLDSTGNLYGTTFFGGTGTNCLNSGSAYCGIVFELTPAAGGGWNEEILHNFTNQGGDGYEPTAGLIFDAAGNLYGTTEGGGIGSCVGFANGFAVEGCGTVFELTPIAGGGWSEKILYAFHNGTDGYNPAAGLVFDSKGNLYGTTISGGTGSNCYGGGGASDCGTVFELMPKAGGGWTEKILHSFHDNGIDGWGPNAGLILDSAGNLYGTTEAGGKGSCMLGGARLGCGTVFEITP